MRKSTGRRPETIDEYLAEVSDDKRAALVRKLVKARVAENATVQ